MKERLIKENINTMTDIIKIQESEYDAILRQAVAVIGRTRVMVETTVCSAIGAAHWETGKLLHDKKIESKLLVLNFLFVRKQRRIQKKE